MSRMVRRAANRLVSTAANVLPAHLSSWSRAMARELAEIPHDRAALGFATGCLRAAITLALVAWLASQRRRFVQFASPFTWSFQTMNYLLDRPRLLGLLCASVAVGLGLAYMATAGAPSLYLLVNLAALVLGVTAWLGLGRVVTSRLADDGRAVFALALPLLATALFGVVVDGASRWVSVGSLSIQVSLIVLPAMIVLYARSANAIGTVGVAIAAIALAVQPDRAMAGVMAAGLAGLVLANPSRLPALALAIAVVAFLATLLLPDVQPAMPFVDRILYTAFGVHALAGLAVVTGCFVLVVPALVGAIRSMDQRPLMLAFGASWLGVVAAAALGNYPTPLVGYSGSAVLGYLLSVGLLPSGIRETAGAHTGKMGPPVGRNFDDDTIELRKLKLA